MQATLYKIDDLKESANSGQVFRRLYFTCEDGHWAVTDVVPTFRNFKNWQPVIAAGVGTRVKGLVFKSINKIDADSPVQITAYPQSQQKLL